MVKIAFYRGRKRLFDRLVQWWTRSEYSHCELVVDDLDDGKSLCMSASIVDRGVRMKAIDLRPDRWDVIPLPEANRDSIISWFDLHYGQGYDLLGLLGFVIPLRDNPRRWWCSEACAAALSLVDPWRHSPGSLAAWARSEVIEAAVAAGEH